MSIFAGTAPLEPVVVDGGVTVVGVVDVGKAEVLVLVEVEPAIEELEPVVDVVVNVKPETVCVTSDALFASQLVTNSMDIVRFGFNKNTGRLTVDNTLSLLDYRFTGFHRYNAVDTASDVGFGRSRAQA